MHLLLYRILTVYYLVFPQTFSQMCKMCKVCLQFLVWTHTFCTAKSYNSIQYQASEGFSVYNLLVIHLTGILANLQTRNLRLMNCPYLFKLYPFVPQHFDLDQMNRVKHFLFYNKKKRKVSCIFFFHHYTKHKVNLTWPKILPLF